MNKINTASQICCGHCGQRRCLFSEFVFSQTTHIYTNEATKIMREKEEKWREQKKKLKNKWANERDPSDVEENI